MRYLRSGCFTFLCLSLPALNSCTGGGNITPTNNVPLEVALASCSRTADPIDMIPSRQSLPTFGWKYRIVGVHIIGPTWQDNPPPISASELRIALRRTVHQAGLTKTRGPAYILLAQIISQQRQGTYQNSSERLVVYYSLIPQNESNQIMRNVTISTEASLHDWTHHPCASLREMQEKLTRDSIRRMFGELISPQG